MCDSSKEHRPLLQEDFSDEDPQYEFSAPLRRPMGYRSKTKNTIKGAATIIKNWPDHWSSSVTYWWAGIAMFALVTFVFYNSVLAFSLIPIADSKPMHQTVFHKKITTTEQKYHPPKVFMHFIVNNEKEANVHKYLPYIEIVANKYLHYEFNLIVVFNDTIETIHEAEVNNEDAMNSLWTRHNILESKRVPSKKKSNIIIQYVSLSNYLRESPLEEFWKQLPFQFIEFLLRAVSLWNKGGIAFNPILLTPKSPDAVYIEKLYSLLSAYDRYKKPNATLNVNHKTDTIEKPKIVSDRKPKYEKRVNNIRDIIDALEMEPAGPQNQPEVLKAAENKEDFTRIDVKPLKLSSIVNNSDSINLSNNEVKYLHENYTASDASINMKKKSDSNINTYMLPSFLDFLFHNKPKPTQDDDLTDLNIKDYIKRSTRAALTESIENNDEKDNLLKPMIVSPPKGFVEMDTKEKYKAPITTDLEKLTIDLKGNILATKSPCHALLGTMFSNVKHHTEEESLKDFIISELSLFCNGLLSTCKGVDVILL